MTPPEVLLLGAVLGLGYGMAAVGLLLVYQASRTINFAHGAVGALAAVLLGLLVERWGAPYWVAFAVALAAGAAVSAGVEVTVVRRLQAAPPVVTLVATLGVAQVLLHVTGTLAGELEGLGIPPPAGLPAVDAGSARLTEGAVALLLIGPAAVAVLWLLLQHSTLGAAMRASAANPLAARSLGIPAAAIGTFSWALAGALSALTATFLLSSGSVTGAEGIGTSLLLRALAAGAVAGMRSLPVALVAGIVIGVVEQATVWHAPRAGFIDVVLLGVILAALLARPAAGHRLAEREDWTALRRWRPLPAAARAVPLVRWAGPVAALALLAVAALAPLVLAADDEVTLTGVVIFALVGLSVWVVTGLGGQLSLGQFGFSAIGAVATAVTAGATGSPVAGLLAAPLAGALGAVLVGIPALRIQGVMLAVATLAFALAVSGWMLDQPWALGGGRRLEKLDLGPIGFDTSWGAYELSLAVLACALAAVTMLARSAFGRRLRAVRDNDRAARAFAVDATRVRLQAVAIGGGLAGLAGGLLAQSVFRITSGSFDISASIDVIAMTVVGGLAVAAGPVVGALYVVALPAFVDLPQMALAASALGWLVLLLFAPGGLAAVAEPARQHLAALLLRIAGHDPRDAWETPIAQRPHPLAARAPARREGVPRSPAGALELRALVRHFGGVRAVDGFSLAVAPGEIVGLVGANGAGKTTVLDLASGYVRPQSGSVTLDGEDVTRRSVQARASRGLIRSFQDAHLFPTLSVHEVVALGLDGRAAAGAPRARVDQLLDEFGLQAYGDAVVHELSTGMRRVTELACMVALSPRVLLLDEPTGGLAASEVGPLADLLVRLRADLGVAMVVVEHDLPLVSGLADRLVVMAGGRAATPAAGGSRAEEVPA